MNRRKHAVLLLSMVLLMTTCGCGFKDLDKRFVAVAIGIDRADDPNKKFKVEIKLAIPSPEEKFGSNQALIVTQEADTMTEAVRLIKSKIDKELDFGQAKAIIIGEQLLKESNISLKEIMDWPMRRRDIQMISWMGVGKPDALTVLKTNPKTERLPSNQLFVFFGGSGTETAYVVSEYKFDFYRRMKERGLDPILPIIETRSEDQLSVDQVAIFDKEKIKLTLTPLETKIFNAFYHQISKTDIPVKIGDVDAVISVEDTQTNYLLLNTRSDKPIVQVTVNFTGIIEESKKHVKVEELLKYEQATEKVTKERFTALLKKLQTAGVDPIGFGLRYRAIHQMDNSQWEQWQKVIYPNIDFQVTTHIDLQGTGVIE